MTFKNIKNKIFNQDIEKIDEHQSFLLVNIIFLIGHIVYFVVFHNLKITPMERYNYFSMVYYLVMIFISVKIEHSGILILFHLLEVAAHSILGSYYLGWDIGFAQYLIFMIPVPFMPEIRQKWVPYVASVLDFLVYCMIYYFTEGRTPKYTFDETVETLIFYLNSFFGLFTILYIISIFFFQRKRIQEKLESHNRLLRKLATTDPLTKLYNRRAMSEYLKLLDKNNKEKNTSYFVGLADIDDFKKINDTYGHDCGDEVLMRVADVMMNTVPDDGCVCRWGGEEILFIIPKFTMEKGRLCAEKIRRTISNQEFLSSKREKFSVTVTIGVYEAKAAENPEKAISHADDRLYIGKNNGKNQVVNYDKTEQ